MKIFIQQLRRKILKLFFGRQLIDNIEQIGRILHKQQVLVETLCENYQDYKLIGKTIELQVAHRYRPFIKLF